MTVAIGVVHDEKVDALWVNCLLRSRAEVEQVIMVEGGPGNFDVARNKVVEKFLSDSDAERLLFIDTDIVFHPEHVQLLVKHDKPVMSGLYFTAHGKPNAYRETDGHMRAVTDFGEGEVLKVDALGCGFALIQRAVFDAIGGPEEHRSGPWFRQTEREEADFAFCRRAKELGIDIRVDTDCFVGHIKPRVVGWQ